MPEEIKSNESTDVEVLFPEQEFYGVKVRPWTFNQFVSLLPVLMQARKELKAHGIEIDNLNKLKDEDQEQILDFLVRLLPLIPAVGVVSKTVGINIEEVEKWEFDKTATIFLIILIQNAGRVKNFFGLGLTAMKTIQAAG